MYRDTDELEDILPESSTQLVSLNTRIPRYISDRIDMSVGILQLSSKYHKVSKQTTVQILLEKGYEAILAEFESMDREEDTPEIIPTQVEPQVERETRETTPHRTYDMEAYSQMANKTYYEPHQTHTTNNQLTHDSRVQRFQKKLGLTR
jgi:hypothetical protein